MDLSDVAMHIGQNVMGVYGMDQKAAAEIGPPFPPPGDSVII